MYDKAIEQYKKAIPLSGNSPDEPATLAYAYAKSGQRTQALRTIEELVKRSERSYVPSTLIAATYAAVGDHQEASRWLHKAVQQRDGILIFLNVDPMFEDLRSDPRYRAIIQQVDLPASK